MVQGPGRRGGGRTAVGATVAAAAAGALACALLSLGGCYEPRLDRCAVACGREAPACPSGLTCGASGRCEDPGRPGECAPDADGARDGPAVAPDGPDGPVGPPRDAATPDAPPPDASLAPDARPSICSMAPAADVAVDDFDDESLAPWGTAWGDTFFVGGAFVVDASIVPAASGGFRSQAFDADGRRFVLEVLTASAGATPGARTRFGLRDPVWTWRWVGLGLEDGVLSGSYVDVPYEPARHRFWQLCVVEGWVHLEASADGRDWQPFGTTAAVGWMSNAELLLEVVTVGVESDPGLLAVDNLNLPPAP